MSRQFCHESDFRLERLNELLAELLRSNDQRGRAVIRFVQEFTPECPDAQEKFRNLFADAINEAATEVAESIVKVIQEELPK